MSQASHPIVRTYRISRILMHILYGLSLSALILNRLNQHQRHLIIKRWSEKLLNILNVKLTVEGSPPNQKLNNAMFVGNHISWLDIYALNSVHPVRFIAKSEVARWPILGWLAKQTHTMFIERAQKKDAKRVAIEATESLSKGDCLCYFPEGTTSDGTELLPFKSSLMQASINSNAEVWPLAIHYPNKDGSANTRMAFVGETTFIDSIWQIISLHQSEVKLHFLPKINAHSYERRELTQHIKRAIAAHLKFNL
jgi:1-acyl-sn-glycerol-3-phosphate acyltransferase